MPPSTRTKYGTRVWPAATEGPAVTATRMTRVTSIWLRRSVQVEPAPTSAAS